MVIISKRLVLLPARHVLRVCRGSESWFVGRSLLRLIIFAMAFFTVVPAKAAVDAVAPLTSPQYFSSPYSSAPFPTPSQACADPFVISEYAAVGVPTSPPYTSGAVQITGTTSISFYCYGIYNGVNTALWTVYLVSVPSCPVPASGAAYTFNPATGMCERTVQAICPVDDLPPITDPLAQAFENNPNLSDTADLTPRMQTALSCLLTAAIAGSPSVGSAYRPPAYNQHLIDVWKKWDELTNGSNSANPACASLKTRIQQHFQRHGLLESQSPVPGSLHTQGEAVDVTINLPAANIDALATGCQLRRPVPVTDPVHFIHQ